MIPIRSAPAYAATPCASASPSSRAIASRASPDELGIAGLAARARAARGASASTASSRRRPPATTPSFRCSSPRSTRGACQLATGVAVAFPRSPMVVAQMAWDLQRFSRRTLQPRSRHAGEGSQRAALRHAVDGTARAAHARVRPVPARDLRDLPESRSSRAGSRASTTASPCCRRCSGPSRSSIPHVPIHIAAVNPYMSRLAGELCDGVFAHPICTARYLREVMLPTVREGRAHGRPRRVRHRDHRRADRRHRPRPRGAARSEGAQPPARRVLRVHAHLSSRLRAARLEGPRDAAARALAREPVGRDGEARPGRDGRGVRDDRAPRRDRRRAARAWSDLLTTLNLPTDFPLETPEDRRRVRAAVETLQRA